MAPLGALVWEALAGAGGGLALGFIVGIFLGLVALTLFYLASAVVVLDRFARAPRSAGWTLACLAVMSLAVAGVGIASWRPELTAQPWGAWMRTWLLGGLGAAAPVGACMVLAALALRLPAAWLARGSVWWVGAGLALVTGGTGNPGAAAVPAVAVGGVAAFLGWRRRRRGASGDETAPLLWAFAGLLTLGAAVALLLWGVEAPALASVGESVLAPAGTLLVGAFLAVVILGLLPLAAAGLVGLRRSAEWFIAARYLVAKRRQTFISVITGICVLGVAAGVWLIITVLSVMNGFANTWRDEIIGNRAHFTVHSGLGPIQEWGGVLQMVRETPGVEAASPYLDAEGMVRGSAGEIMGVRVRGVDVESVGRVTDLEKDLIAGGLDRLAAPDPGSEGAAGTPGIVVGHQLAASLGLGLGDPVLLVLPYGGPQTPLGPAPRLARFRVAGVFESSFFQYDEVFTYVSLEAAQDLRRVGDVVDGIEARTRDFYTSARVAEAVRDQLGFPYFTRDWKEYFPAFFQALKSERVMMSLLLTMIMVVAAFVIVTTLVMMVMEKSSDIAILKAMGAEDGTVERIFAIEGTLIGLAGTALGVVAALAVTAQLGWIQERIEGVLGIDALPGSIYQLSTLPADMDPAQVAIVASVAMVLSLGATLLPSRQGARLDPAEALRHE